MDAMMIRLRHCYQLSLLIVLMHNTCHCRPTSEDLIDDIDEEDVGDTLNLKSQNVGPTSIELTWDDIADFNYRIWSKEKGGYEDVKTVPSSGDQARDSTADQAYQLRNLKPFTEYEIWVKAVNGTEEGVESKHITVQTDVAEPSSPVILNATCSGDGSQIYVEWEKPKKFYKSVDLYKVYYRLESDQLFDNVIIDKQEDKEEDNDETIKVRITELEQAAVDK